jgi:hypothetical protein
VEALKGAAVKAFVRRRTVQALWAWQVLDARRRFLVHISRKIMRFWDSWYGCKVCDGGKNIRRVEIRAGRRRAEVCKNSKEMEAAQAIRWCCRCDIRMATCRAEDQALAEMWTKCHADMAAFADRGRIRGMEGEDVCTGRGFFMRRCAGR